MRFIGATVVAADHSGVKLHADGISPAEFVVAADGGRLSVGDRVEMGIRAEDLSAGDAVAGHLALTGVARQVENMGHSSFWYGALKGGEADLIARLDKQVLVRPGTETRFSLDPASVYLFDGAGIAVPRRGFENANLDAQRIRA
jgi:ABC-type sugar transport system ATPase subunit